MKRAGFLVALALGSLVAFGAEKRPVTDLPEPLRAQAQAAQAAFAKGDYRAAAEAYEALRLAAPRHLYVLSNLAVVQMRMGSFGRPRKRCARRWRWRPRTDFAGGCSASFTIHSRNTRRR